MNKGVSGPQVSTTIGGLSDLAGSNLGTSSWRMLTQEQVNQFADLTGDHNPVHIDSAFAQKTPFGDTIVHGYFTLALVVPLMDEIIQVTDVGTGVNYGLDKLRFPAPVPVGDRIRLSTDLADVSDISGGVQVVYENTFEAETQTKPAAVSTMIVRYYA